MLFRSVWSCTIGLLFFALGLVLFLLLDILMPSSDRGYRVLNSMYKVGSLGMFKGLKVEKDDFDIIFEKRRL